MNVIHQLLDNFIAANSRIDAVVLMAGGRLQVSPHVYTAIKTARKLLPLVDDYAVKNQVVTLLHDIYKDLRADIKLRGIEVNGQKHPALDPSLQAYRIIIS
jgi:HD superfamily phosphohydrolase YqeK